MNVDVISLRGVRVHNLQGIDVDIPLGRWTAVTGVSGAGKSSLVFDTLYTEAQRRFLQGFSPYTRQFLERFDRPDTDFIGDLPPAIAVGHHPPAKNPRGTVGTMSDLLPLLGQLVLLAGTYHCPRCQGPVRPASTADVLAHVRMLPAGTKFTVAFPHMPRGDQTVAEWVSSLLEAGFVRVQTGGAVHRLDRPPSPNLAQDETAYVLVDRLEAGPELPARLTEAVETAFAHGGRRLALVLDQEIIPFDQRWICTACDLPVPDPAARLLEVNDPGNEQVRAWRLNGVSFAELTQQTIAEIAAWSWPPATDLRRQALIEQIRRRLNLLVELEVGYVSLDRTAATLSIGAARRLDLARALSASLAGGLYLLNEPSAGLHPKHHPRLTAVLSRLRDEGATLVVVDHASALIAAADQVIDLGPGAGEEGGRVVYQGGYQDFLRCEASVTAAALRSTSVASSRRRQPTGWLRLAGATTHNLPNLAVDFPLGVLTAVTGVSGAGKSALVEDTLMPLLLHAKKEKKDRPLPTAKLTGAGQIDDVVFMDQSPPTRTARSNPATYLKLFDDIRELFAETADAKIRNLGPGAFSFNQPGGRCETCQGQGSLAMDMQFLADAVITCPECQGTRFTRPVLAVKVRSLSIADVLNLTVREAFRFFRAQPGLQRKLKWLLEVGLDYLRLGQSMETLSGGECQRLKLAGHLAASRKPRTLFILAEPTIGLHPADVDQLIACCQGLVDAGHSVLVVDNNEEMAHSADHVIELHHVTNATLVTR